MIGAILICVLFIAIIIAAVLYTVLYNSKIIKIEDNSAMTFKSAMELAGLPIITFYQGKNKYHFLIDTGSDCTYINNKSDIKIVPIDGVGQITGCSGEAIQATLANVTLYHQNKVYEHTVRVADFEKAFEAVASTTNIQLTGIIGTDFMEKYKYCIDFAEYVIYRRRD